MDSDCEARNKLHEERWKHHDEIHRLESVALELATKVTQSEMRKLNELRTEVVEDRSKFVTKEQMIAWMLSMLAIGIAGVSVAVALMR